MTPGSGRPTRLVGHVDMDSFFASVEIHDDPSLAGKPVVVGGPAEKRGVVAAASYEARRFGVHSAMPMARALQLCPDLVRVPPRGGRYKEVSEQVFGVLLEFSPTLEPLSLDEAFLDLSGTERLLGDATTIATNLKARIREVTGLVASVGIGPNKFTAKLASDHRKPDGLCVVEADQVVAFVQALPIERMWGVGQKTLPLMRRHGIVTIGDLAALEPARVKQLFGLGALKMYEMAHGRDDRPVVPDQDPRQVSHEITFARNQSSDDVLKGVLLGLCEQVATRLRRHDFQGKTITLKIRFGDFRTVTRRTTLGHFTADSGAIYEAALPLLEEARTVSTLAVRLIGVGVSGLAEPAQIPLSLFDAPPATDRAERLNAALDRINDRFGQSSVRRARTLLTRHEGGTDSNVNPRE